MIATCLVLPLRTALLARQNGYTLAAASSSSDGPDLAAGGPPSLPSAAEGFFSVGGASARISSAGFSVSFRCRRSSFSCAHGSRSVVSGHGQTVHSLEVECTL